MAVAAWPGTLPQKFQKPAFALGSPDGRIASKPDTGPSRIRRRTSTSVTPFSGTIWVTAAQAVILRDFIKTDLAGGTLPFTFPDPLEGADLLVRFDPSQALPSYDNLGGDQWEAVLRLEVLP